MTVVAGFAFGSGIAAAGDKPPLAPPLPTDPIGRPSVTSAPPLHWPGLGVVALQQFPQIARPARLEWVLLALHELSADYVPVEAVAQGRPVDALVADDAGWHVEIRGESNDLYFIVRDGSQAWTFQAVGASNLQIARQKLCAVFFTADELFRRFAPEQALPPGPGPGLNPCLP